MGRVTWATYLWPGLPRLYRHGSWAALAVAVGFAALVNLALAASLVWTELAAPGVRNLVWAAVAVVWVASALAAWRRDRRTADGWSKSDQDAFAGAQDHYLKGNWFEAERLLGSLLARDPRDPDAGLMLATLFRHTGRYDEAADQLERIERFESCRKWELEIRRERELLNEADLANAEPSPPSAQAEPNESTQPIPDAA